MPLLVVITNVNKVTNLMLVNVTVVLVWPVLNVLKLPNNVPNVSQDSDYGNLLLPMELYLPLINVNLVNSDVPNVTVMSKFVNNVPLDIIFSKVFVENKPKIVSNITLMVTVNTALMDLDKPKDSVINASTPAI
mmetsp:Transcript_7577/g.1028  ORF Transcript_7577/g.1028 Transcript_7577/m.1028 type:complete len:134 (-) Transcript_7577:364-765(-)